MFQSKSSELNTKIEYSSDEDEGSDVDPSSYQSDATLEEESNDGSVFSHESEGMISCSKSENDYAYHLLHFLNQFGYEEFQNYLSLKFQGKEMVDKIDANKFEHDVLSEGLSKGFISNHNVVDQGLDIAVSSCSANYVRDDITNVSRSEVVASLSQSYASEESKSYVSDDEFEGADPTFQD